MSEEVHENRTDHKIEYKYSNKLLSLHPGGLSLTLESAQAAGMKAGDHVLDIGCGTGTSLAYLSDHFGILPYGVDLSEMAVRNASSLHPSLDVRQADAACLPFSTGSFDCVMTECVLTLLEDPQSVISEAIRVLKPGGCLIISTLTGPGAVDPQAIENHVNGLGLRTVLVEDRTKDLTQYMVDTIMEFGSLENRIHAEQEVSGASVLDCSTYSSFDPKKTGYSLLVFRVGTGTPVDRLVAERIGVRPEELTQEAVEHYQTEALRRTVSYAKEHSRYYKNLLSDLDPETICGLDDLRKIPVTRETDLAGNESDFQCISPGNVDRMVTVPVIDGTTGSRCGIVTLPTTGTSGTRKRIAFTNEDQERSIEFINRGFLTQDCTEGEKMLVMMSGTTEGSIGDLVMRAMKPLKMKIRVYGAVTNIEDAYRELLEFRPEVVEAISWHAAALARYGTRFGNPEKEFIRSVNLSADVVPEAIVNRLETLWNCNVHRHYGTTEMAIFGGVECIHHRGYHTRPCDIIYEIPETGDEGYGEMLITTLDRTAMPLIRYSTGDIARFTDEPCPCGCRIRRIERFKGRRTSLINVPGSSFYLSELADALYSIPEVIDFDITLDQTAKTVSGVTTVLRITVRTLPGEELSIEKIEKVLHPLLGGSEDYINSGALAVDLSTEKTLTFPSGYNLKKKISYII